MYELSHEERINLAVAILSGRPLLVWNPKSRSIEPVVSVHFFEKGASVQLNLGDEPAKVYDAELCAVCGEPVTRHKPGCTMLFCDWCGFETEHVMGTNNEMECCNVEDHAEK